MKPTGLGVRTHLYLFIEHASKVFMLLEVNGNFSLIHYHVIFPFHGSYGRFENLNITNSRF